MWGCPGPPSGLPGVVLGAGKGPRGGRVVRVGARGRQLCSRLGARLVSVRVGLWVFIYFLIFWGIKPGRDGV